MLAGLFDRSIVPASGRGPLAAVIPGQLPILLCLGVAMLVVS